MQNDSDFPALGGAGDIGGNDADKGKVRMVRQLVHIAPGDHLGLHGSLQANLAFCCLQHSSSKRFLILTAKSTVPPPGTAQKSYK